MRVDTWLASATKHLNQANIATARLDSLVLLEDVTKFDRAWLLAHPEHDMSSAKVRHLNKLLRRRVEHMPLAYIRGFSEFYGRDFIITPAVLEPRPESETMIDVLKSLPNLPPRPYLVDIGSGSGAIGITAKLELPRAKVDLIDIDARAVKVSKDNVDKFTLNISTINSDLLSRVSQKYDILLCNLPYIPDDFQINRAALKEPAIAIFGGPDGLDTYRSLFAQVPNLNFKPLYILCESLPSQHSQLQLIASKADYGLYLSDDFIQVFRPTSV